MQTGFKVLVLRDTERRDSDSVLDLGLVRAGSGADLASIPPQTRPSGERPARVQARSAGGGVVLQLGRIGVSPSAV